MKTRPVPIKIKGGQVLVPIKWAAERLQVTRQSIIYFCTRKGPNHGKIKLQNRNGWSYIRWPEDGKIYYAHIRPTGKQKERTTPDFSSPFDNPEKEFQKQQEELRDPEVNLDSEIHASNAANRKSILQAKTLQLEYDERIAKLIPAEDIKFKWDSIALAIQKAMMSIPDRLSPILAGEKNSDKVHKILSDEIRHALTNLGEEV